MHTITLIAVKLNCLCLGKNFLLQVSLSLKLFKLCPLKRHCQFEDIEIVFIILGYCAKYAFYTRRLFSLDIEQLSIIKC